MSSALRWATLTLLQFWCRHFSYRPGNRATVAVVAAYPGLTDALNEYGIALRIAEKIASQSEPSPQSTIRNSQSGVAAALAGDIGIVLAVAGVAETGSVLCADETLPA